MRWPAALAGLAVILFIPGPAYGQGTARGTAGVTSARAARIREEARSILSAHEFRDGQPSVGVMEYIGRQIRVVLDGLGRWLSRLFRFGGMSAPVAAVNVLYWVLLGALVVGMAYVLAFALRRYGGGRAGVSSGTVVSTLDDLDEAGSHEPDVWMSSARRHAAAGDYLRAYRALFVALLLRLDQAGIIQYERARTNGEYLRALRSRADLLSIVRPLSVAFDAHWYGRRPVAEAEYAGAMDSYERVVSLAARSPDRPSA